jgi:NodT family efflux transporter outer membrane factor (OMF) lipoprotein
MSLLAGCNVGPDYHAPATTMPADWAGPTRPATSRPILAATTQPVGLIQWWSSFGDPELDSLVHRAAASNLDLRLAIAVVRQARATRGIAVAVDSPVVNATGAYQQAHANSTNTKLYQGGLDASWEIDIFGGGRRGVEAADSDLQASIEASRGAMVSLVAEVAMSYLDLRGAQQQIRIAQDNIVAQEKTADLTRRRFVGGLNSALDVANADAQVVTTKAQIPPLEVQVRQDIYALSVLLAREPAALVAELTPQGAIPATPPAVPMGLPSELLRRRPDIRQAESQLHAATARIGVATADLFPQFSLTGTAGLSGNHSSALVNWNDRYWSLGPTVNWNVFDGGAIRANIQVQDALTEEALVSYQKAVLTALQDVENSLVAYVKEQEHRELLAQAVGFNTKAVALAVQLYTQGQTDFLNVTSAQQSLYSSQAALTSSNLAVASNLVSLYKALGGGWESEPEPGKVGQ